VPLCAACIWSIAFPARAPQKVLLMLLLVCQGILNIHHALPTERARCLAATQKTVPLLPHFPTINRMPGAACVMLQLLCLSVRFGW
jgi:hypothetical protein